MHLKKLNLSLRSFENLQLDRDPVKLVLVSGSQHGCAISGCTWAPKLLSIARKCEIKHWLPCGADGRSEAVGVRSRDYQFFQDGQISLAMRLRSTRLLYKFRRGLFHLLNFQSARPHFRSSLSYCSAKKPPLR